MFKRIIGIALLVAVAQGTAFAADFLGSQKSVVENKLGAVSEEISKRETKFVGDYESPAVFANFREIKTTGLKPQLLYRSSSPVNIEANKNRHKYADALAREFGIQAEIDLADDDADLQRYFKNAGARKKYCYSLYQDGKLWNKRLHGDGRRSSDWEHIAAAFRFMLKQDGPYLIHCRLGKDRAGFFSMLCSALAGATINDLRDDYMQTYCNYNHIEKSSYEYEIIRKFRCDKIIYYIAHPEYASDKQAIPDDINVNGIVPEEAAVHFFKTALKFSDAEIVALQNKLKAENTAAY